MALSKVNPSLAALRNSALVLLAAALHELFPTLQLCGGHATTRGFVYDVVGDLPLDMSALAPIEERMRAILARGDELISREMLTANAAGYFRHHRQNLRADRLMDRDDQLVTLLQLGDFMDVTPYPHVNRADQLRAVRLLSVTKEEEVIRIIGTVQPDEKALKAFVKRLKVMDEVDHRLLGRELGLFSLQEDEGICLWHPKGAQLRRMILSQWEESMKGVGFQLVSTTGLNPKDNPSLGPSRNARHAALYAAQRHIAEELPLGYAESSEVYLANTSEEASGLLSLPVHTVPEGHLFCLPEQVKEQLHRLLRLIQNTLEQYRFQTKIYLIRGSQQLSKQAFQWLQEVLQIAQLPFELDASEPALDGPRIDFRIIDRLGTEWLASSLAINVILPEQLNLQVRPVMIAVQPLGSLERWIGLLLEQTAGVIPSWLAPEQIRLLPIASSQSDYAKRIREMCEKAGLRVGIDASNQRLAAKIFAFEKAKVPLALILGDQEQRQSCVTLRRLGQSKGQTLTLNDFLASLDTRSIDEIDQLPHTGENNRKSRR